MRSTTAACWLIALALGACSAPSTPPRESAGPPIAAAQQLLAPSVRRLSVAELSAAASELVQGDVDLASALPPDARQNDFSRSLTQSVDATTLKQLDDAARAIAAKLPLPSEVDANALVTTLASRAFRRAPTDAEVADLRALFDAGASGRAPRDGAELVVRALFGSPELLYETALDSALSSDELASHLAWLVSGLPPDAELRRAASAGELQSGPARRQQALRLLHDSRARFLYRRFIEEWLGLNRLRALAKSSDIAADFPSLRETMLSDTEAAIDDAFITTSGSLQALFASGYAAPNRDGLLQQESFLATFAHEDSSAPVLRGKAVLERLLCRKLVEPSELGIDLVLPQPDPHTTTRERFAQHAERTDCNGCHEQLDGVGFTFENFDAIGGFRSEEAGKPIDSSGHITLDGVTLTLGNSVDLSRALAASQELEVCAARQLVRFASGTQSSAVEDDFVAATRRLPDTDRTTLIGLLLTYVEGDWFAKRSLQ
ncbi:MAG TPA: DUF1588 domain-containing protein [Polyangiaceae bacterium]|nr:DUF1588 domain-containing protein [Polyangiaceae bacterium]